ncbi:strictosidine synthase family protein [Jiulongibacter sp. NS-SX5]|uniref:strictosidine synthase family protein n=1 Tax=Jiulongibacter sp. NS-SX5 TaxID=3463854 RepID=UPI004059F4A7
MKSTINGIIAFLVLIALCVGFILKESGFFVKINPHFDGTEEVIDTPPGIEDITVDQTSGDIYFSSTDRRDSGASGAIYKANLNASNLELIKISGDMDGENFRPHGISLLKKNGLTYIFAVNHGEGLQRISRLTFLKDSLINVKHFEDDLIISPNDIVAIDTATFYFTNDHGEKDPAKRRINDFLIAKESYAVLYHEGKAQIATQKMAYANGINVSPDQEYLYVTATTERKLYVYQRNQLDHTLQLKDELKVGSGVDNIEIDKYGNLMIGSHPKMLKFLSHAKSAENRSPSQVFKVVYLPDTDYKFLQEELYINNGDPLSASSVAAYYEGNDGTNDLVIGSVFDSKILRLHRNL